MTYQKVKLFGGPFDGEWIEAADGVVRIELMRRDVHTFYENDVATSFPGATRRAVYLMSSASPKHFQYEPEGQE
jgi:hypothetical protein